MRQKFRFAVPLRLNWQAGRPTGWCRTEGNSQSMLSFPIALGKGGTSGGRPLAGCTGSSSLSKITITNKNVVLNNTICRCHQGIRCDSGCRDTLPSEECKTLVPRFRGDDESSVRKPPKSGRYRVIKAGLRIWWSSHIGKLKRMALDSCFRGNDGCAGGRLTNRNDYL